MESIEKQNQVVSSTDAQKSEETAGWPTRGTSFPFGHNPQALFEEQPGLC